MTLDSCTVDGQAAKVDVQETLTRVDLPRPLARETRRKFGFGSSCRSRPTSTAWVDPEAATPSRSGTEDRRTTVGDGASTCSITSEFYGEFGTYDVSITLPDRFWVGSTGVLEEVRGGDNEIPLFASKTSKDSVTVSLRVSTADSLAGHWPARRLEVSTDLAHPPKDPDPPPLVVPKDGMLTIRVPRGAHSYIWEEREAHDGEESKSSTTHAEADESGEGTAHRPRRERHDGDRHSSRASAAAAPTDGAAPSEKTLRYHAEHVHDFAWSPPPTTSGDSRTPGSRSARLRSAGREGLARGQRDRGAGDGASHAPGGTLRLAPVHLHRGVLRRWGNGIQHARHGGTGLQTTPFRMENGRAQWRTTGSTG